PLRVLWLRYLRAHRRSLRKLSALCLSAAALMALSYVLLSAWREPATRPGARNVSAVLAAPVSTSVRREPARPALAPARPLGGQSLSAATPAAAPTELPGDAAGMSTRMRLVRADALLRHPSEHAARQARAI